MSHQPVSAVTVFYFTYAAVEIPSNLLLKKFKPSVWLPTIMVAWGVVTVINPEHKIILAVISR